MEARSGGRPWEASTAARWRPPVPSLEPVRSRAHQAPTGARMGHLKHVFVAVQRPDARHVVVAAVGIVVPVAAGEDVVPDQSGILVVREAVVQTGAGETRTLSVVPIDLRVE